MVLMSIERGRYVRLDAVGCGIWERIAERRSLTELVDALAADYDAPRDVIRADVEAWLAKSADMKIVQLS
jgi:hypothetical protein